MRTIILVLVAILLVSCAYTVTVEQAVEVPTIPPPPTSTMVPTEPVSPLFEPVFAPVVPATFNYGQLLAAAAEYGVEVKPGSYTCDGAVGEYTSCRVVAPGLTREALCVWPGGAGVCE